MRERGRHGEGETRGRGEEYRGADGTREAGKKNTITNAEARMTNRLASHSSFITHNSSLASLSVSPHPRVSASSSPFPCVFLRNPQGLLASHNPFDSIIL
jgi:hypothetical protein